MINDLTVIICCAGMGKRLGIDYPKALLNIDGKPLIIRILEALNDVKDIRIVVGFKYKELMNVVNEYRNDVLYCINRDFKRTGPAASLQKAFKGVNDRVLIIDGDVVVDPKILASVLTSNNILLANLSNKDDGIRIITDSNKKAVMFTRAQGELTYAGIVLTEKDRLSFLESKKYIYECLDLGKGFDVRIVDSIDVNSPIDYTYALNLVKNNYKEKLVIGCLGGMGTYATINFFKLYADIFQAKFENERPRLLIDNNCTMPSRVRAYLYGEKKDILVNSMADSLSNLILSGATRLVLGCNTSHLFLDDIYKIKPELRDYIVNIMEVCGDFLKNKGIKQVFLLGTEATIDSNVFGKVFSKYGIDVLAPSSSNYQTIRNCIEAVKRNIYTAETEAEFISLFDKKMPYVLGCTELPVLFKKYYNSLLHIEAYDPLELSLRYIKDKYF